MSSHSLAKLFNLTDGFSPPEELIYDDIVATPLTRQHLDDDLVAVNSSIEIIRKTRGGSWPEEELEKDFDFLDLAWHEREFRDRTSFAYAVYTKDNDYIGCFYLYPIGIRTPLDKQTEKMDVDVSWWVSADAYEQGYYEKLHAALEVWMPEFPFKQIYYSNAEIPA